MIACVDVYYHDDDSATAAAVVLERWTDAVAAEELVCSVDSVAPYQPGQFYKRELGPVRQVLALASGPLSVVVIDGYVYLDAAGKPGLGAHLHRVLGCGVPVVGVAKSPYRGGGFDVEVRRGQSKRPLHVTAVGMDPAEAARQIGTMHGPHRIPTLLKRVDLLSRSAAKSGA